jgi:hypothetical protein
VKWRETIPNFLVSPSVKFLLLFGSLPTGFVTFNNGVMRDLKEAILLLPAHKLLPLEGIHRLINNANKNVALVQVRGACVAIVIGSIDERHQNWGNLLLKLGFSALAAAHNRAKLSGATITRRKKSHCNTYMFIGIYP